MEARNGTPVARYAIRFAGGRSETQEVLYGRDILACGSDLYPYGRLDTIRVWPAFVAHTRSGATLRLHTLRWRNPRPAAEISAIDLTSLCTVASPLLLAITVER